MVPLLASAHIPDEVIAGRRGPIEIYFRKVTKEIISFLEFSFGMTRCSFALVIYTIFENYGREPYRKKN
jgi:hypothetical protein